MRTIPFVLTLFALAAQAATEPGLAFEKELTDATFERARREHRRVVLDLEAVWCHWCHVMDEKTYADPKVRALLSSRFLLVKVDQDSRPDLANRYDDYGWPATIFYDEQGKELAKRSGYLPPEEMLDLLKRVADAKKPLDAADKSDTKPVPGTRLEKEIESSIELRYDPKAGGWDGNHRYLDRGFIEYALDRAPERARQTLDAAQSLIDPVWGGAYQYSVSGTWTEPHYEKIISVQADFLAAESWAYAFQRQDSDLKTARAVVRYLENFLTSPEGEFYVSQDADVVPGQSAQAYFQKSDVERRKIGLPAIDRHVYARENGWVIESLALLGAFIPDPALTDRARTAARRILQIRGKESPGGPLLFRHGERDEFGAFLGDTLAMGRAFLALYETTAEREWLALARKTLEGIRTRFVRPDGKGYLTSANRSKLLPAVIHPEENLELARFATRLFHYTGDETARRVASSALDAVSTRETAGKPYLLGSLALAIRESSKEPVHLTIVGSKDDPQARALFAAALRFPAVYRRIEWWDRREGPLPRNDVSYPSLASAAAFACSDRRCSLPATQPEQIGERVRRMLNGTR